MIVSELKDVFESSSREKHNPIELMKSLWENLDEKSLSHITYDPKMKDSSRDFFMIRGCGGDGTLYFTISMFEDSFLPLLNMVATHASNPPDQDKTLKSIHYTIGTVRHATVYGRIKLRCSKTNLYSGQRERVRFPVKVTYIYN